MDVAPQEERSVGNHMESCESCAKFHHQLQQVIMASEEVPLPDDMAPPKLESLARTIMENLPQPKQSPFAFFAKLFGGGEKKEDKKAQPAASSASRFPHVSRNKQGDTGELQTTQAPRGRKNTADDHAGTANRLKALAKGFTQDNAIDNREAQSQTKSLGEKFGMSAPAGGALTDEQPLTLAESIRRKISETQKPAEGEEQREEEAPAPVPSPPDDGWASPASVQMRPPANMAAPPTMPGRPGAPAGDPGAPVGGWSKPSEGGWDAPQGSSGPDDWNFQTAPSSSAGLDPFAAPPSVAAQPAAFGDQAKPSGGWDGAWEEKAPKGAGPSKDSDWGPPPQGGTWDEPAQTSSSPSWDALPGQAQSTSGSGAAAPAAGRSINSAGIMSSIPAVPATPPVTTPAPNWGTAPIQPPAAQADPWGGGSEWGAPTPTSTPSASTPWGGPEELPKVSPPQAPGAWNQPLPAEPAGQSAQGPGPAPGSASGADWAASAAPAGWAQPAVKTDSWAQPGGAGWTPPNADQWASKPADDWSAGQGQPPVPQGQGGPPSLLNRKSAWSQDAEQIETGTWRAFAPSGEGLGAPVARPGLNNAAVNPAPAAGQPAQSFAPQAQEVQDRWDLPIQERMKAQQQANPASPAQPQFGQGAQAGQLPQGSPAQPKKGAGDQGPAPTKSGWNFPTYDGSTALKQEPQTDIAGWPLPGTTAGSFGGVQASAAPSQPAPAPQNPNAVPVDSIIDRLGSVLTESSKPDQPTSHWEMSIQERQQQQQQQPQQQQPQPQPTEAPPPPGWAPVPKAPEPVAQAPSGWGQPVAQPPQHGQAPATPWSTAASPAQQPPSWRNAAAPASPPAAIPPSPQPQPVAAQANAPAGGPPGLFQNLDDQAIDRLFSENLGVQTGGPSAQVQPAAPGWGQQPPSQPQTPPANPFASIGGWGQPQETAPPPQPAYTNVNAAQTVSVPAQGAIGQPSSFAGGSQPPAPGGDGMPRISAVTPKNTGSHQSMTLPGQPIPPASASDRRSSPFSMPVEQAAALNQQSGPAQAPAQSAGAGLFNLDDSAMDKLFSDNLGVKDAQQPPGQAPGAPAGQKAPGQPGSAPQFSQPGAPPAASPAPRQSGNPFAPLTTPQPPAPPPGWAPVPQPSPASFQQPVSQVNPGQQQAPSGGLFSIDDSVIDRIFADNLGLNDASAPAVPKVNVSEAIKSISEVAAIAPVPPPKVEGVGRLDSRTEAADSGSGRIASIGKFLLDQKDLEKIGKLTSSDLSDTKMRILTTEAAQELQTLLNHIGAQEQVVGSVIVGHDGLLIANSMTGDLDAESIGVWALGVYMSTEQVIKKMGQDRVHQIVSRTPRGYVVIADFGGGLLVTVSDGKDTDSLIPLMRSITQLVQQ